MNIDKDIEILKEFIKNYKEVQEKYKDDEIQAEIERSCYFEEVPAQAIENVLKKLETQTNGINYLQRQLPALNKEIKTKDEMIDLMAEEYSKYQLRKSYMGEITETAYGIKSRIRKEVEDDR